MAVLDGDPDGPLERYRILNVEVVENDVSAPIVTSAKSDAVVGSRVLLLGAPSCVEVVFGTGAVQGRWPPLPIYKDHVVPLPVPVPLASLAQVAHVHDAPDVLAVPLGFEDGVVARPARVLAAEEELSLLCPASSIPSVGFFRRH